MGSGTPILLFVVFWVVPAGMVASYAERKGHSFWGYLIFGVLLSPFLSLVVALVVQDRRYIQPVRVEDVGPGARVNALAKLAELHSSGALTENEYAHEKARVLTAD